jgi:hypothetical protein
MATNNSINANSTTPLPIVDGGTQVTSVTIAPAATAFAGWDANKNLTANSHIDAYTTTATGATTTTLVVGSTRQQFFTGSTTQTVILPVTSTLVLGQTFLIVNNSSGVVTVQSSGGNTITAMAANTISIYTCILTSGTTAASWNSDYNAEVAGVNSITGTANQVIASAATGAVTLSLPQSIGTASAVQFASVNFGGSTLSTYTSNTAWTPVYTVQLGFYTRIGNIVIANFALSFTPTWTTSSGAVTISGLPVASNSTSGNNVIGNVLLASSNIWPVGTSSPYLFLSPGAASLALYGTGSATSGANFTTSHFATTVAAIIDGTIIYSV